MNNGVRIDLLNTFDNVICVIGEQDIVAGLFVIQGIPVKHSVSGIGYQGALDRFADIFLNRKLAKIGFHQSTAHGR